MLICVRCVTCNKVLADKWDWYQQEVLKLQKKTEEAAAAPAAPAPAKPTKTKKGGAISELEKQGLKNFDDLRTGPIMDKLGLTRICCRRHMLTTVDMMEMI